MLRTIYLLATASYLVLLLDTYILQSEDSSEQIASFESFQRHLNRAPFIENALYTKSGKKFVLPEGDLSYLSDTSQLIIMRGLITSYPVYLMLRSGSTTDVYATSFLKRNTGGGLVSGLTALAFLVASVFLFFRKEVPIAALCVFLFLLFFSFYETIF